MEAVKDINHGNQLCRPTAEDSAQTAESLRWQIGGDLHDRLMEASIYTEAAQIADRAVTRPGEKPRFDLDRTIDRIVTSKTWGFPAMFVLLYGRLLADHRRRQRPVADAGTLLLDTATVPCLHPRRRHERLPAWLSGLLIDGIYLATAWVIA
jgi:ferrous iron transport protein B